MEKIIHIKKPQDWHHHFRDGSALSRTVPDASRQFSHALAMPNLTPPIVTVADALQYRDRLLAAVPADRTFEPCMSLYLTAETSTADIEQASQSKHVIAAKLYPAGATTNSDEGIQSWDALFPVLKKMQETGLPLCIHGEVTDPSVDIFDREAVFIEQVLAPLLKKLPELRVILEHITTQVAVDFVRAQKSNVAATITAHHLWLSRNDMLAGGIRPHLYCLPILKRESDRQALIHASISGDPHFFLGTDSAPHTQKTKQSICGCAGIYTAHAALALYTTVFEQYNALHRLSDFSSHFGAAFYGITTTNEEIELIKRPWQVPESLSFAGETLIPFAAGETLEWQIKHDH
jgi:dihydroorotase